jgi:hypothetical protein
MFFYAVVWIDASALPFDQNCSSMFFPKCQLGINYEVDFTEDADMMPPRDYCISLEAYFLMLTVLTPIKILTKLFASEKKG